MASVIALPVHSKTTQQILSELRAQSAFYPSGDGADFWISSVSRWTDETWYFDIETRGQDQWQAAINWNMPLPDGQTLTHPSHARLLREFRYFAWSLIADRRQAKAKKVTGIKEVSKGLRRLAFWMVEYDYASFSELNARSFDRYVEWLVEWIATSHLKMGEDTSDLEEITEIAVAAEREDGAADDAPDEVDSAAGEKDAEARTEGAFSIYLKIWHFLWQQRHALVEQGIGTIADDPLSGQSVRKTVQKLATKATKRIPALPDAVAIPIMNAAQRLLGGADDLISMVDIWHMKNLTAYKASTRLHGRKFSILEGEDQPWHPPLRHDPNTLATTALRPLIDAMQAAGINVLQSETGMRIGEVNSVEAGFDAATGLPACIEMRPSKSGMMDLFYIRATLSKMRRVPTTEKWLLAARPRGSNIVPPAVRAVEIMLQLFEPFRQMSDDEKVKRSLFIRFKSPHGMPFDGDSIATISIKSLGEKQKQFFEQYVDWDAVPLRSATRPYKESKGRCIVTHQWRKTYAQFVFQTNPRLLPAISRQFKHLSIAMTESAYVGTDISLVRDVAEHNRKMTTDFLLLQIRGAAPKQEGRLAKLIEEYRTKLAEIIAGKNELEAESAMGAWVDAHRARLFFHGYGKCMPAIAPTEAECHKRSNTVWWGNTAPNFATREPSVCTGCFLFLADEDTIDYWTERYIENQRAWLGAKADGLQQQFRVVKGRAEQSAMYLKMLGAPIPSVELTHAA